MPKKPARVTNGTITIPTPTKKKKAPVKKKPKIDTPEDDVREYQRKATQLKRRGLAQRASSGNVKHDLSQSVREIGPINFSDIDWDTRNKCKYDLETFCKTYIPNTYKDDGVFYEWSADQRDLLSISQKVVLQGGKHARAMPRGGGKTSIVKGTILWAALYGHISYTAFIGSTDDNSLGIVDFLKSHFLTNNLLLKDFPESVYPLRMLEGNPHKVTGQIYLSYPTHIRWAVDKVRLPSIPLNREQASQYPADEIIQIPYPEVEEYSWCHRSSGSFIDTFSINGSIRGQVMTHPLTLSEIRPQLVIADDVQKDQGAESPATIEKLIRKLDGAIDGLGGPTTLLSCLQPCTVIAPNDLADTYLNPEKKPEWNGVRNKMVLSWPPGITDTDISDDTPAGKLWTEYADTLRYSLRTKKDISLATDLYDKNRKIMDENFVVSWKDRYNRHEKYKGNIELSAQQHAMNLRLKNEETFASEYQNCPFARTQQGTTLISAQQFSSMTIGMGAGELLLGTSSVTCYMDVQDELLYYCVVGFEPDLTGVICDYGTFPEVSYHYFTKAQTAAWCLLSRHFKKSNPDAPIERNRSNRPKARLDDKIYWSINELVRQLFSRRYIRQDGTEMGITKLGIDTRWGEANDSIKRAIRNLNDARVIACSGQPVKAINKQFEEYGRTTGWLFEDHLNPQIQEVKWVYKPDKSGMMHLLIDANRAKSFLFRRLAVTPGSKGSLSLYQGRDGEHDLFCHQVCDSEFPTPVGTKGRIKEEWEIRERTDNEYLDCLANCVILGTFDGCRAGETPSLSISSPENETTKNKVKPLSKVVGRKFDKLPKQNKSQSESPAKLSDIAKLKNPHLFGR